MIRDYLGKDTKFPISDKFELVQKYNIVLQDLQLLIATIPGERVMRPTYGCRLYTRVWDNIYTVAQEGLQDIRDAIVEFEPRVQLLQVRSTIDKDLGLVRFIISFNIVGENNPQNLVFPFQTAII